MSKNVKIFHCNTLKDTKRTENNLPNNRLPSGDLNKTSQRGTWEKRVVAHDRPLRFFCSWHSALCKGCLSPARSRCQNRTAKSSGRSHPTLKRKTRRSVEKYRRSSGRNERDKRASRCRETLIAYLSRKKRSFRDRRMSRNELRMLRRAKNSRESRVNEHATFSPARRKFSESLQIRSATQMLRVFQYNFPFFLRLSLRLERESLCREQPCLH